MQMAGGIIDRDRGHELGRKRQFGSVGDFAQGGQQALPSDWPDQPSPKDDPLRFLGAVWHGRGCDEAAEEVAPAGHQRAVYCQMLIVASVRIRWSETNSSARLPSRRAMASTIARRSLWVCCFTGCGAGLSVS